jgi:hypothetical protein
MLDEPWTCDADEDGRDVDVPTRAKGRSQLGESDLREQRADALHDLDGELTVVSLGFCPNPVEHDEERMQVVRSLHRVDVDLLLLVGHGDELAHALLQLLESDGEVADILAEDLVAVDDLEKLGHVLEGQVDDALEDLEEAAEEVVEEGGEGFEEVVPL